MTNLQALKEHAREMIEFIERMESTRKAEPEFEYPIFKKSLYHAEIIKFTDLTTGTVVFSGNEYDAGYKTEDWAAHTDKTFYSDVPHNKERDLYHGQVCYCIDNDVACGVDIRFYDAINDCTYSDDGKENSYGYHNYEAVPYEHIPEKMIEAYSSLEGI